MQHEFTAALSERRMPHRSENRTNQLTQGGNIFKAEVIHVFVFAQMMIFFFFFPIRSDLGANPVAGVNAFQPCSLLLQNHADSKRHRKARKKVSLQPHPLSGGVPD